MAEFKISRGLQASYDALTEPDPDTIYVCLDTGHCYLCDIQLSPDREEIFTGGVRVFYNGVDVTDNENMRRAIANAPSHWYGTEEGYQYLVDNNLVQANVAYHVLPQTDWEDDDPTSLGHIKNKPQLLDMRVEGSTGVFFYK